MYPVSLTPAFLLFLLLLPLSAGGQSRSYVFEREDAACGELTLSVERLANGYVEYSFREELRIRSIADREEQWLRECTILADTALRVISIDGFERRGEVKWDVKGSCVNDVLHMSREYSDGVTERWRDDCGALPDIMLAELLRHPARPYPGKVLSTRQFESSPAAVRITESGGVTRIQLNAVMVMEVGGDGLPVAWVMPDYGMAYRSVSSLPPGACDLDGGVLWVGDAVQLPTAVENIRNMDVRVALTGTQPTRLFPEDHRQRVVNGAGFSADTMYLRIERAYQQFEEETLPLLDPSLLPYLKSSHYLSLDSDRIRDRAAVLRNWDRNAANVARDILKWCGDAFVEDALIPVLPADRFVQAPRGGALHAAILFVALARKAGIPARFVLGMLPSDGKWKSTVWAEAWSGEWVSVDPLRGEILQDAFHVKLLHAATFQELRQYAAQLRGTVHISVEKLERIDPSAAAELPTAIVNGVYSNRRYRCEIAAPEGWLLEERNIGRETVLTAVPELGSEVRFELHLFANPWLQPTEELFETRVRALSAVLVDAQVEEKGELIFGNRRAPYVLYSYRDSRAGSDRRRIRTADCMFSILERGYLLRFTAPQTEFDNYADQLKRILQSMKLYERE
ncbi:MAG: transglutaminase domain-containing protein [Bacteroidota bacterium]|nr:transglutaminase domain-containing protein [Bacteroidota bacterium]